MTNLIFFNDKVTLLLDERKAVDFVYLDYSKAFDSIPQQPHGEAGGSWLGEVYSLLKKNTGWVAEPRELW